MNPNVVTKREFFSSLVKACVPALLVTGSGCSGLPSIGKRGSGALQGSNWVGRRYFTRNTRFWGYVRRPGDSWDKSQLVIFNEKYKHQPDRLPETLGSERGHGFDHNYEYSLVGQFSGNVIYDPNSDKILPEFVLRDYKMISETPGRLFPGTHYSPYRLPPRN